MRGLAGVVLSIAAHAIAIAALILVARAPEDKARVSFMLAPGAGGAPAPESPTVPAAGGAAEAPPATHAKPAVRAKPRRAATVSESGSESDSESGSESDSESGSASGSGSASASAPAPVPASVAVPPTESPDPESIRASIASSIHYPRLARTQGLQGEVIVRFRIDPSGAVSDLSVVTSVAPLLDAAARDAVLSAAPYRSPPGWVRVPVIFSLHDAP